MQNIDFLSLKVDNCCWSGQFVVATAASENESRSDQQVEMITHIYLRAVDEPAPEQGQFLSCFGLSQKEEISLARSALRAGAGWYRFEMIGCRRERATKPSNGCDLKKGCL